MQREYYSSSISDFLEANSGEILGILVNRSSFNVDLTQRNAWNEEIKILQDILRPHEGRIYFEYSIPRMGQRIDVLMVIGPVIFVLEFKVGEKGFHKTAVDQVWDYSLDLKNFHETSHGLHIAPVLIATEARRAEPHVAFTQHNDKLLFPIFSNSETLAAVIDVVLGFVVGETIDQMEWERGRYCPTPTIIEAATALYGGHSVEEISRSDASAINLKETTQAVNEIIKKARDNNEKSICFVTGVPGAGKTLVGLDIANSHMDPKSDAYSVFLSGNGPLVAVLREALTRDKVLRSVENGNKMKKGEAMGAVKSFIQNVHHFRDECLQQETLPPVEHVVLFDEAQRAWDLNQTSKFMQQKKAQPGFHMSEPEFLISCMDRHKDWAVVVCLVGGGQEINTGEAGIGEWLDALNRSFPSWKIYISKQIHDSEYAVEEELLPALRSHREVIYKDELHLSVSMRSFRAEHLSTLVKHMLDLNVEAARETLALVQDRYPVVITRCLKKAKAWLKQQARGSERYGMVVSSQASRLKPHAIDVRTPIDPIHWFLDGKEDVRSSYYLEDAATEFQIQGLELDWACVAWDADFRFTSDGWSHHSFRGNRWTKINKDERKTYLKNAYRVLLTRARQGMVIVVPDGNPEDWTRVPSFYDETFEYLVEVGFVVI